MRNGPRLTVAAAALLVVAGCSGAPEIACTEIGAASGIQVIVTDDLAADVTALSLDVCTGGSCRTVAVQPTPGTYSSSDDCPITTDDSSCSATMVPDGTLVGFADVPELEAGHAEVGAAVTVRGKPRRFAPITVDVSTTYPNGEQCPAGGNQGTVEVRASGLVTG